MCIPFSFDPIIIGVFVKDFIAMCIIFSFDPKSSGVFVIDEIAILIFNNEWKVFNLYLLCDCHIIL